MCRCDVEDGMQIYIDNNFYFYHDSAFMFNRIVFENMSLSNRLIVKDFEPFIFWFNTPHDCVMFYSEGE